MAIQMRRGQYADFDPSKMTPGEWAVAIDNDTTKQIIWMCFAPGVVKRIGTYEDYIRMIDEYIAENYSEYIPDVICPVEPTSIASRAYAVDDLVITLGKMYKVTQAIAQGANLVPDVNLTETTVEDEIKNSGAGDVAYAMIAVEETTSTASKSYGVGDYLIYNDTLYRVIAGISSGDTLTPDTNIEAVTVGGELFHHNTAELETYAMMGSYEPDYVASKTYYSGDYIICAGWLWRVTSYIAQNSELVPNTNMTATTLGDEIAEIVRNQVVVNGESGTMSANFFGENYASADYAVAEGYYTSATASAAHAEGQSTTASGAYGSHAEGDSTTASGDGSHAEGMGTVAAGAYQHVSGKYNIEDSSDTYAEIVGGGDDTTPANIRTLDWSGNAVYAGKVTAGADAVNSNDVPRLGQVNTALGNKVDKVTGKQLSTEDYTTAEKTKLSGIEAGAQVNVIETVKVNGTALTPASKAVDIDLSNYATKADISTVYKYKGSVTAYADLPATGQAIGDVYNVETADSTHGIKAGDNVAWNGSGWDVLAGTVDLSAYATKAEVQTGLAGKENTLTWDNTPTENSTNPVTSGGLYTALSGKQGTLTFDNTPTDGSGNPVSSDGLYDLLSPVASEATGQSMLTTETSINTNLNTLLTTLIDAHPTAELGTVIVHDIMQENIILAQLARNIEESGVF